VRILFAFAGGQGHLDPLVPLARAVAAAGHDVAVTGRGDMLEAIRERGFEAIESPGAAPDPAARAPLAAYDPAHDQRVLREWYAGELADRRAVALTAVARAWGAERIVRDEVDFGARAAAVALGLGSACVLVIAAAGFVPRDLAPDPRVEAVLSPFPASLRAAPGAVAFRAGDPPQADGDAVYLTLGTVFNTESGDLLPRALAGVRSLGLPVVVTTGRRLDPAELGPQPGVRIQPWIPHEELLPWCRAVVTHGGSGCVLGARTYGLPSVLLPIGADQPLTAARVAELGAAVVLDPVRASSAEIAAAVRRVLGEPAFAEAARRVRGEVLALPPAAGAVAALTSGHAGGRV
jgi:UDP:flavonoid glycosyltransferase YjiC (YdhE family)